MLTSKVVTGYFRTEAMIRPNDLRMAPEFSLTREPADILILLPHTELSTFPIKNWTGAHAQTKASPATTSCRIFPGPKVNLSPAQLKDQLQCHTPTRTLHLNLCFTSASSHRNMHSSAQTGNCPECISGEYSQEIILQTTLPVSVTFVTESLTSLSQDTFRMDGRELRRCEALIL